MSYHTLLGRRNHSHDAFYPVRNFENLSQRVSSLPRINVSSIHSGHYSAADSGYENFSRLYIGPETRRSLSNTCAKHLSCPYYSGMAEKSRYNKHHRDLKRRMVFDLHKEIQKPVHTFTLEEISNIDRITEICMDTLRSMMTSRIHRKYLHHINNNAKTTEMTTSMDITNNQESTKNAHESTKNAHESTKNAHESTKNAHESTKNSQATASATDSAKEAEQSLQRTMSRALHDKGMRVIAAVHEDKSKGSGRQRSDTPINLAHLSQETRDRRKQRQEEIIHIKKLQTKMITDSLHSIPMTNGHRTSSNHNQLHDQSGSSYDMTGRLNNRPKVKEASSLSSVSSKTSPRHSTLIKKVEDSGQAAASRKLSSGSRSHSLKDANVISKLKSSTMNPIDILECKYLRLNDEQVRFLEEMVRANGKNPGIHPHSKVGIGVVFDELHASKMESIKKNILQSVLFELDEEDEDFEDIGD